MMDNTDRPDSRGLVAIATYSTDWEAHIAQGVLDAAGIESTLGNEIFSSIYPIGFNSLGGVTLYTLADDAARATEILGSSRI